MPLKLYIFVSLLYLLITTNIRKKTYSQLQVLSDFRFVSSIQKAHDY